ncbi:Gfo/Idh/MocA family oxidoreductase, partial [Verrucomicrobiales bacterium]|nr:Gfo/Idh/MocA family oxidoreductase [Verrucomicrobiales bacterium]
MEAMSNSIEKPRVAIIGLGFGAEFIPIYQRHPDADIVAICQRNPESLKEVGDKFCIKKQFTDYDELLADPDIDAVHINTPIPDHAEHTLKAMKAGKHVACTVPMATSEEDCKAIVELSVETGLHYMMMETVVYAREFLYMKELYDTGELGKLQFLKASHQQDMDGWPGYWPGLPPMHYATHCVGPVLGRSGVCELFSERHDSRGNARLLQLAIRCRDHPHQVCEQRSQRAGLSFSLRRRSAVSRKH